MDGITFFFFSSRRRHTRCSRDWSSDVCSSDLSAWRAGSRVRQFRRRDGGGRGGVQADRAVGIGRASVGEEGRSRGAPDHLKKKKNKMVEEAKNNNTRMWNEGTEAALGRCVR